MKKELKELALNTTTVEDVLRVVLQDKEAKIFKKNGDFTKKGEQAHEQLRYLLFSVSQFVNALDNKNGIELNLVQVEDLMDDMSYIVERGY